MPLDEVGTTILPTVALGLSNPPANAGEMQDRSPGREDPLEEGMATYSGTKSCLLIFLTFALSFIPLSPYLYNPPTSSAGTTAAFSSTVPQSDTHDRSRSLCYH